MSASNIEGMKFEIIIYNSKQMTMIGENRQLVTNGLVEFEK